MWHDAQIRSATYSAVHKNESSRLCFLSLLAHLNSFFAVRGDVVMSTISSPDLSGDRWLVISDTDRRGTIMVVAIICCVYCPMILGLRAVGSLKNLGINDFLAIAATVRYTRQRYEYKS